MKILSSILVLFLSCITTVTFAQSSATVKQKGHNNSVSISQSTSTEKDQQSIPHRCKEMNRKKLLAVHSNIIKIDQQDTTIYQMRPYLTHLATVITDHTAMEASQMGQRNGLYVTLPDSQDNKIRSIYSTQRGIKNQITAQLADRSQDIILSQTGSNNTVTINPCNKDL